MKRAKWNLDLRDDPRRRVLLDLGWYSGALHRGVARFAREANWVLDISSLRTGDPPLRWDGDGIVCVLGSSPQSDRLVQRARVPVVSIGPIEHPRIPRVGPDNPMVGRLAAEHFIGRGFRHFAFYMVSRGPGETARMEGFRAALKVKGFTLLILDWTTAARHGRQKPDRFRWLAKELSRLPQPLAVMAEYDDRALDVLEACRQGQIAVPEQVAVLGCDDDPLRCEFARVPLSSVDLDLEGTGFEAARLLDRMMRGSPAPRRPILIAPRGVTARQSTDILAVEHAEVAQALRLIWQHYTKPITAQVVARQVPMSARRLHDAFVRHVGRSMAEEIARKRVERAQELLKDGRRKIREVAELSGFSRSSHLIKVFRRLTGQTPAAWRGPTG